ncbi:hypothetical protein GOBAR_AA25128 [Gossypium barbadense]|uniref:Uncharacterized protein n=1 Tax=Gossypium barbadense TaxID=3634 RepID=A0A2P5WWR9_GOSBA|nr:hypothetical protein GOBAR_AA25128 [Gossypium barbadense]
MGMQLRRALGKIKPSSHQAIFLQRRVMGYGTMKHHVEGNTCSTSTSASPEIVARRFEATVARFLRLMQTNTRLSRKMTAMQVKKKYVKHTRRQGWFFYVIDQDVDGSKLTKLVLYRQANAQRKTWMLILFRDCSFLV